MKHYIFTGERGDVDVHINPNATPLDAAWSLMAAFSRRLGHEKAVEEATYAMLSLQPDFGWDEAEVLDAIRRLPEMQ